jgi:hypothetical protein
LRADVLRAVDFRDVVFFRAELVFVLRAELFRADVFFREDPERVLELRVDELLPDEREPERDEERVVAGTARATSALSSLVSPRAISPHVSPAVVLPVNGSLSEPAFDG